MACVHALYVRHICVAQYSKVSNVSVHFYEKNTNSRMGGGGIGDDLTAFGGFDDLPPPYNGPDRVEFHGFGKSIVPTPVRITVGGLTLYFLHDAGTKATVPGLHCVQKTVFVHGRAMTKTLAEFVSSSVYRRPPRVCNNPPRNGLLYTIDHGYFNPADGVIR